MKSKRYTTEERLLIFREADGGARVIAELCQEKNISELTFHRRRREFGMLEVNEAKRAKELERENTDLNRYLFGRARDCFTAWHRCLGRRRHSRARQTR